MRNDFSLEGKTILITGASSGLGRQCAITCSEYGARLIIVGRNEEKLSEVMGNLSGIGHAMRIFDLMKFQEYEKFVEGLVSESGKINGFLHSAGIGMLVPVSMMNTGRYHELYSLHVVTPFELTKLLLKKKTFSSRGASLVFISSAAGVRGEPGKIGYSAAKAALINGTKVIALELAQKGIRANCISPGLVLTDLSRRTLSKLDEESIDNIKKKHPLGFGSPMDIALASVFLLSDASGWITATNLEIDGGKNAT